MTITSGICVKAKLGFVTGVHQPGDQYMVALYSPAAQLSPFTEIYTPVGEVEGQGYKAGGLLLTGYKAATDGTAAVVTWDSPQWPVATITARGVLIYNRSKGNAAIYVGDLGRDVTSTNGPFKLSMPPLTATEALIWIG